MALLRRSRGDADTYGVEIAPDEDRGLVLAITVCIDAMSHRRN
jgi:uncharacterized protein YxjI